MSENIAAAIAAKNEVIAQQGTSLDEVAAVLLVLPLRQSVR